MRVLRVQPSHDEMLVVAPLSLAAAQSSEYAAPMAWYSALPTPMLKSPATIRASPQLDAQFCRLATSYRRVSVLSVPRCADHRLI